MHAPLKAHEPHVDLQFVRSGGSRELELQGACEPPDVMWVLGTEAGLPGISRMAPKHPAISLARTVRLLSTQPSCTAIS